MYLLLFLSFFFLKKKIVVTIPLSIEIHIQVFSFCSDWAKTNPAVGHFTGMCDNVSGLLIAVVFLPDRIAPQKAPPCPLHGSHSVVQSLEVSAS